MEYHRLGGFVILKQCTSPHKGGSNWLYLRRHSDNILFAGNLPWPLWLPLSKVISNDHQQKLKSQIATLFPGSQAIQNVFSTENGRIAVQIEMRDADTLNAVLSQPNDHVYLPACNRMRQIDGGAVDAMKTLTGWLRDHEADRNERTVTSWSEAAMRTYETRERLAAEVKAKRDKAGSKPDDDGFVTITNGAPQMKLEDARALVSKHQSARPRKTQWGRQRSASMKVPKGVQKTGFYRWERPNSGALVQLRNKFRDDQKRVVAIRNLKPLHATSDANSSKSDQITHRS